MVLDELTRINPGSSGINKFWSTHQKALKEIRNGIIAHRDHNAKRQIEMMKNLSADEIKRMGVELMGWTNDLLHELSSFISAGQAPGGTSSVDR